MRMKRSIQMQRTGSRLDFISLICVISPFYNFHHSVYVCCTICYKQAMRKFKECNRELEDDVNSEIKLSIWILKDSGFRNFKETLSQAL